MIERVHIKNFKSIYDLDINVGRINLFIGENGSGKSNLLEALVFVSASQSNKLDNEFLVSRGLRLTEPVLMRSAFDEENSDKSIEISIGRKKELEHYEFKNENSEYSKWKNLSSQLLINLIKQLNPAKYGIWIFIPIYIIVIILTYVTVFIMRKIPIIRKYI